MIDLLNDFCSIGLSFKSDGFRLMYFVVSLLVFVICTLYATDHLKEDKKKKRFYISWVVTFLSTVGVLFAGDLFTCFMFFEIMSFASSIWVFQRETAESDYAGRVYLRISVICGMVMLYGLILVYYNFGTLDLDELTVLTSTAPTSLKLIPTILLCIGFGAKAGVFFLHVWLPKAYVQATTPGTACLSAILSKAGIIGMIITSSSLGVLSNEKWGNILLVLGALTMVSGAVSAIFTNDLKKTVACSSLSQIGFIVTGLACAIIEPGALAYGGTVLHMLNHTLIKTALFIAVGAIYKTTGTLNLNDLKGYGRNKPLLLLTFAVSGLSLAGMPLFSGFVSKNMMHEALDVIAVNSSLAKVVSVIFTVTGGMTLCYMLKLFICLFVEKGYRNNHENKNRHLKAVWQLYALIPTLIVFTAGILPKLFSRIPVKAVLSEYEAASGVLGFDELTNFNFFAPAVIKATLISLVSGICFYLLFVRIILIRKKGDKKFYTYGMPSWMDLEKYVYRPVFMYFVTFISAFVARLFDKSTDLIIYFFRKKVFNPLKKRRPVAIGNSVTYGLGTIMDKVFGRKRKAGAVPYVTKLALVNEQAASIARMIERSLSLSMLLFSTGLVITLIYMLFK